MAPPTPQAPTGSIDQILTNPLTGLRIAVADTFQKKGISAETLQHVKTELAEPGFIQDPEEAAALQKEFATIDGAIRTGRAPHNPNLEYPSTQLLWATAMGHIISNPGTVGGWPPMNRASNITKTALWKQITNTPYMQDELRNHAFHISDSIRNPNARIRWGTPPNGYPAVGYYYNREENLVSIDLVWSMLGGVEHSRAANMHEIGHSQLTIKFTRKMQALREEMEKLEAKKKQGGLTPEEYKRMARLEMEWQLRFRLFDEAENNVVDRYAANQSERMAQDYAWSRNNVETVICGAGQQVLAARAANMQPQAVYLPPPSTSEQEKFAQLCRAIRLSFFRNNGLFADTDEGWKEIGVDRSLITALPKKPGAPAPTGEQAFAELMEYCGGKQGLEHLQPTPRDRLFGGGRYAQKVEEFADRRNAIIDDIFDRYAVPLMQKMLKEKDENLDQQMQQDQPQDQGDGADDKQQEKNDAGNEGEGKEQQDSQSGAQEQDKKDKDPQTQESDTKKPQPSDGDTDEANEKKEDQDATDGKDKKETQDGRGKKQQDSGGQEQKNKQNKNPKEQKSDTKKSQSPDGKEEDKPQEKDTSGGDADEEEEKDKDKDASGSADKKKEEKPGEETQNGDGKEQQDSEPESGDKENAQEQKGKSGGDADEEEKEEEKNGSGDGDKESEEEAQNGADKEQQESGQEPQDQKGDEEGQGEEPGEGAQEQGQESSAGGKDPGKDGGKPKAGQGQPAGASPGSEMDAEEFSQAIAAAFNPQGQEGKEGEGQTIQVIGVGDMPDIKLPPKSPRPEKSTDQDKDKEEELDDEQTIQELTEETESKEIEDPTKSTAKKGSQSHGGTYSFAAPVAPPTGEWNDYMAMVTPHAITIRHVAEMLKKIQEKQIQMVPQPAKARTLLPDDGDLTRFQFPEHRDLMVKRLRGQEITEKDFDRFVQDTPDKKIPAPIDIVIMIDGSGSMRGEKMESAIQTGVILYEAAKLAKLNPYILMWGNNPPMMLAKPGDNPVTIGKSIAAARQGYDWGTDLAPAVKMMTKTIAERKTDPESYIGCSHFFVISDGDINDFKAASATIKQLIEHSPHSTLDVAIINPSHTWMDKLVEEVSTTGQNKCGVKHFNRAGDIQQGLVELLRGRMLTTDLKAIPHRDKIRELKTANQRM